MNDTTRAAMVTRASCTGLDMMDRRIYGIDFGAGDACAIFGEHGVVSKRSLKLPRRKGGKTPAMEFIMILEALLGGGDDVPAGDVVVESATIGSSGCEPNDVLELLRRYPDGHIYTISNRAVKNYRADHPDLKWKKGARYAKDGTPLPVAIDLHEQATVHVEDAEIIYKIATETPHRLHNWTGKAEPAERIHSSVRPMDKHLYRNETSLSFLKLLPPFASLPDELREVLGTRGEYSGSIVMPFAMASTEPYIDDGPKEERRRRYEKLIGLYDRGYPSFYRRATIVWMQLVAKRLAGVTRIGEVDASIRKQAWKITQRQIRWFFHLTMAYQGR